MSLGNLDQAQRDALVAKAQREGKAAESREPGTNTALDAGSSGALALYAKAMSGDGALNVQQQSLRAQNRMEEHLRLIAERAERQQRLMDSLNNKKTPTVVKMG